MKTLIALIGTLCLFGCTTSLSVSRIDLTKPETRVGLPYPLMFTQYEVDITRQVTACGPALKGLVKAEVKGVTSAPDPEQLFVIDPNSLSSPLKTSEVKLEYQPNGAPSSLNAAAEDRTAQVVANVVATAVKVVSIAAMAGKAPEAPPEARPEACSKPVLAALEVIKAQTPIVEAATTLVEALTADLKAKNARVAALGSNVDEPSKMALAAAYDALAAATKGLGEKKGVLDKAIKVVTNVETIRWPDNGDTAMGNFALEPTVIERWGASDKNGESLLDKQSINQFTVFMELEKTRKNGRDLGTPEVLETSLGIPIRQPVQGRFKVCAAGKCGKNNLPIADKVGDVLQLGYVYYLPCKSRPFSSISCSFTMTEAGQLKTIGAAQKAATAEGLSGTTKDLATQAATAQEALSSAKTKRLEAETAALKAQANYAAAAAALQPDPLKDDKDATAALKASTDLLIAQKAELDAKAALAEAMLKAGKGQP